MTWPLAAGTQPDLPVGFLHSSGSVVSFVDVELGALSLAGRLRQQGVRPGDRVLLHVDNTQEHLVGLLALLHLDVSLVLVDTPEPAEELGRVAVIARVKWFVSYRDAPPAGLPGLLLEELLAQPATAPPDASLSLASWSCRVDALVTWSRDAGGGLIGVVRSGRRVLLGLEQARTCMAQRPAEVLLPLASCAHVFGLSLVLVAWASGSSLALVPVGQDLEDTVGLADACEVTVVAATSSTYEALLDLLDGRPQLVVRLRHVRAWWCGGAAPSAGVAARFERVMGRTLLLAGTGDDPRGLRAGAPDAWVLHRDPVPPPVVPVTRAEPRGTGGEVRALLEAVRDDPATLTRVLGRLVQGERTPSQDPVHTLTKALGAELDEVRQRLPA